VQYRADLAFGEDRSQRGAVAQICLMELDRLSGQLTQPLQHRRLGVREVIDDGELVARRGERNAGVRTDVAEAAGDEDGLGHFLHAA
jgi:hypothetical protein